MGERFGDYEIEGRLGAGGMAEVYAARRAGPEGFVKRVCLKRVLDGSEADKDAVAQFHDEARLCAHLHHPGIAGVHELGQVDGKWFMAMELVDGMDLRSLASSLRSRGATLPIDVAIHVVRSVADALAYAHAFAIDGRPLGIVHRDVTPSNVLLSIHGEVKLADFGIARSSVRTHRTRSGIVKGKVPYMAPEQALGETLDRRADVFSLGVVAFELIGGRRPHDGATDLDTLTNAQRGRRPFLRELAPETPEEVVLLVTRMLAGKREDRVASADEVSRVLAAIPTRRDPRLALATLVADARSARSGAPQTRVRGRRVAARVDHAAQAPTAGDDGPTEVAKPMAPSPDTSMTSATGASTALARPARPSRRWLPFAIGFVGTMLVGTLAAIVIVLALGGDRLSEALGRFYAPLTPAATPIDAQAPSEPPKPPPDTLAPPPPTEVPAAPSAPPAPSVSPEPHARRHRTHAPRATPSVADAGASTTESSFGRVQVVAIPFGEVEIDGRAHGRAPLTIPLEAGRHTVVVSNGGARIERQVTVDSGTTERVVVDLLEMH